MLIHKLTCFSSLLKPCNSTTNLNSVLRNLSNSMGFENVQIPVPWGHIAGKWWGPKDKQPIISIHGWQDNCGTFDQLIPKLPNDLSFLAIDLPGHGLSSNIPPGLFYFKLADVMLIRRLQTFFNLDKLSLMGHSLGATTCYTFAGLFPKSVNFLICIEGLCPMVNQNCVDHTSNSIDRFLKYDAQVSKAMKANVEPPSYTMQTMVEVMYKGMMGSVDKDKCKYLLERNMKESLTKAGMYYFDRDPRIKSGHLINWSIEDLETHAQRITCPILGTSNGNSPVMNNSKVVKKLRNIIIENNPKAEFYRINTTHHGHLNTPEYFSKVIAKFIEKYNPINKNYDLKMFESIQ